MDTRPQILVIGYGNPLRGDDGFGWRAAAELSAILPPLTVEVIACHQLTPELAEPISRASLVIFIDAGAHVTPGSIDIRELAPASPAGSPFTHSVDPAGLLLHARELYGSAPKASMITVGAETFVHSEALSPAVAAALPAVVQTVIEAVRAG